MALKIPVKVNNVNNLTDARYCAGMGVTMIGFYMDRNEKGGLTSQKVLEITSWISGIEVVGEFDIAKPSEVVDIAKGIDLNYFQFNNLNPEIKELEFPIIQKLIVAKSNVNDISKIIREYAPHVSFFLIESYDYQLPELAIKIKEWLSLAPIILGVGIQSSNLDLILNDLKPTGISINGGDEIRPGYKNLDELIDILEALEVED